jgi:hypothetical protein
VDVAPKDVDLVVSDAVAVGEVLRDLLIYPVARMKGWAAEWFGCAFSGCLIEWIAEPRPSALYGDGPHELMAERRVVWRPWSGMRISSACLHWTGS